MARMDKYIENQREKERKNQDEQRRREKENLIQEAIKVGFSEEQIRFIIEHFAYRKHGHPLPFELMRF